MKQWETFVQQGILGTNRQPLQLPTIEGMAALWSQVATFDQETQFLQAAALLGQYRIAGSLPVSLPTTAGVPPCPAESTAPAPTGAVTLLRQLLTDGDTKLLAEWLHHAADHTMYAPHALLPPLLELAIKQRPLAAALAPCLGERGRWLMGLHPAWQITAAEVIDETDWRVGSSEARLRFLQEYRRRDPLTARTLLEASWTQEPAKERALLLGALRSNLSTADEPFLEQALGDRSQAVRTEAVRLLAGLSGLRLQQSLLSTLTTYVTVERKWLRRTLQVQLPPSFQPDWAALGIREQSPLGVRVGQKAGWLVQLVALLPPSALVAHLGVDAVEFLDLVRTSDFAEALRMAVLEGAETHQDHAFLLAELHHLQRLLALDQAPISEWLDRFVRYAPLLPPPTREQVLQRYLTTQQKAAFPDWTTLGAVMRLFDQLSVTNTTQLLQEHLPLLRQRNTNDYGIGRILLDAAYILAPAGYPVAVKLFVRPLEERPDYIDHFLRIYQVRYQMEKEFSQ